MVLIPNAKKWHLEFSDLRNENAKKWNLEFLALKNENSKFQKHRIWISELLDIIYRNNDYYLILYNILMIIIK